MQSLKNPNMLLQLTDFNHNYGDSAYLFTIPQVPNFIKIRLAVFQVVYEDKQRDRRDEGNTCLFVLGTILCKCIYTVFSAVV